MRAIILYFTDRAKCRCGTRRPPLLRFTAEERGFFLPGVLHVCNKKVKGLTVNDRICSECPPPEAWRRLAGWLKLARAVREFVPEEKKSRKNLRPRRSRAVSR